MASTSVHIRNSSARPSSRPAISPAPGWQASSAGGISKYSQPSPSSSQPPAEHVAEEGARRLGVVRVEDGVDAGDHGASLRSAAIASATASGRLAGSPCPAPGTTTSARVGQRRGEPLGRARVALVALAGDDRDRHRAARRGGPTAASSRRRPSAAQRGGERRAGRCAAGPRASAARPSGGRAGEQRQRRPALGELLDRALLDLGGEALVGGAALGARARRPRSRPCSRRARGGVDALRVGERDVQRDAPAHRVAAQHEARGRGGRRRRPRTRRRRSGGGRARRRGRGGRARAGGSVRASSRSATGPQPWRVPAKPCRRTTVSAIPRDLDRDDRHVPAAARVRRRARALRRRRRVHVARLALDAARAVARARRAAALLVARRRARRRASTRSALAKATGRPAVRRVHERDRGRPLPARRRRGARGARPAHRADRRPPARAARGRRRADDRPARPLRARGQVVLRRRPARRRPPSGCAGCARSPAGRCGRRSATGPARCT